MKFFKLIIILCFVGKSFGKLPSIIPKCQRNDPNISVCIATAIEKLIPQLALGDFGDGYIVPKIEPIFLKDLNFGEGQGLDVYLYDVFIHGTSKFKVDKLRANMKDLKYDALISVPILNIQAKYRMKFNFLGNNLKTSGDYFVTHINPKMILQIKLKKVVKNGIEVVRFEPIQVKYDVGTLTNLKITNLFGGNKVIEEIIHAIIINNREFAVGNALPVIEANLSRTFTEIANKVLETTTFDEMFPA